MKLLVLILFILSGSCQQGSLKGHRVPASKKSTVCRISLQDIFALRKKFKPPSYNFRSQKESLSRSIPQYQEKIRLMEASIPGVRPFVELFHKEFARNPTNMEIIEYFKNSIDKFSRIVSQFYGHGELTDQLTNQAFDINKIQSRYNELLEEFLNTNRSSLKKVYQAEDLELYTTIRSFKSHYYGMLGEFDVAMRLRGTLAINIFFKESANPAGNFSKTFSKSLNLIINKKFEHLKTLSNSQKKKTFKQFPHLFKIARFHKGEDQIDSALMWIKQKEIDIIVYNGNKYKFVEVKNLSKSATLNVVSKRSKDKKSLLEQSIQMREIVDFLGISNQVDVEIFFRRGVDKDAAELFKRNGITARGIAKSKN